MLSFLTFNIIDCKFKLVFRLFEAIEKSKKTSLSHKTISRYKNVSFLPNFIKFMKKSILILRKNFVDLNLITVRYLICDRDSLDQLHEVLIIAVLSIY